MRPDEAAIASPMWALSGYLGTRWRGTPASSRCVHWRRAVPLLERRANARATRRFRIVSPAGRAGAGRLSQRGDWASEVHGLRCMLPLAATFALCSVDECRAFHVATPRYIAHHHS